MELLKVLCGMVLGAYLIIAGASYPLLMYHANSMKGYFNQMADLAEYHEKKGDYFFDGANSRGLLDICRSADGQKVEVLFKEDCAKTHLK